MDFDRFLTLAREILPAPVLKQVNKLVFEHREALRNAIPSAPPYEEILALLKPVYIRRVGVLRDMIEQELRK